MQQLIFNFDKDFIFANDFVVRVPYPLYNKNFTESYNEIYLNVEYEVIYVNRISKELHLNINGKEKKFWIKNFKKVSR